MDGAGFESEDENQHPYGSMSRATAVDPRDGDVEAAAVAGQNQDVSPQNVTAMSSSSTLEPDRPSIFSPNTIVLSRPHTPVAMRPINSPLQSAVPLVALASSSSSNSRRTARFVDHDMSVLADSALPQAEKDGDDPSTPQDESPTQNREDATPATLTRFLASHSAESPSDSGAPTYTEGNGNLVRRCKY
jgi:hypothetical protein